jgi:hypothetical protein
MSFLRTRWAAVGAAIAITLGAGGLAGVQASLSSGERAVYIPISPCRLIDTRPELQVGTRSTPLGPGETITLNTYGSNGQCTLPSDFIGLVLNVTAVGATLPTFLTVWPTGPLRPNASSLNPQPSAPPTPNAVTTRVSTTGQFNVYNLQGTVHILADVVGYYVDHNHDDRYLDRLTVRMSVNPSNMVGLSEYDVAIFGPISPINGCVTVNSDAGIGVMLPLDLPVGAHLLGLDIGFFDGSTAQQYRAYLYEYSPWSLGLETAIRAYIEGGSSSGSSGLVKHHVAVNAETVVGEGDVFSLRFQGLPVVGTDDNGVCYVTVEYEQAP